MTVFRFRTVGWSCGVVTAALLSVGGVAGAAATVPPDASTPPTVGVPVDGSLRDPSIPPPDGLTRIYDDTGRITVVVPNEWNDVETHNRLGNPGIAASPDITGFHVRGSESAGVLFVEEPRSDDLVAMIETYNRDEECASGERETVDSNSLTGEWWIGRGCGTAGAGVWMVAALHEPSGDHTYRLVVRVPDEADAWMLDVVTASFGPTDPATAAEATLPPSPIAATASPAEVAIGFVDALAAGDPLAVCSLFDPVSIGHFVSGVRSCTEDVAARMAENDGYWIEPSLREAGPEEPCGSRDGDEYSSFEVIDVDTDEPSCVELVRTDDGWRVMDSWGWIWPDPLPGES